MTENKDITRPDVITPDDVNGIDNGGIITSHDVNKADNSGDITPDHVNNTPVYISKNGVKYNGQNLKPYNKTDRILTSEEAKRRGRLGAQKSVEVRKQRAKERRTAQDILKAIAEYQMTDEQVQTVIGDEGRAILGDDKAAYAVMLCRQLLQGMDGDTKAAQFVRDTMGDAPIQKTEAVTEIITSDDVSLIESVRDVLTG